ncbi:hypothetical protein Deima_2886 [Deinococcus maricopensis DSM 21211]|uniref:GCN5-related N-acetyltransferase n=1 Tax=Deinococcus maricopensis (strain DSM 21211 / LMG 22137 / NRRL B-23946 / LB-34) TaxID=709986 RepID=E8UBS6_DEIML|nr:hypothetical protein Deima_2886 [Deinococcus maricopensis DSM 21211]
MSRLPAPPSAAVSGALHRLAPDATLPGRLGQLGPDVACWVAVAGGRVIGCLLAERDGGGAWARTLVLDAGWRGKGIEGAFAQAADEALGP